VHRRKRGERDIADTPGDVIVRKLTVERIEELKRIIQEEKSKYRLAYVQCMWKVQTCFTTAGCLVAHAQLNTWHCGLLVFWLAVTVIFYDI